MQLVVEDAEAVATRSAAWIADAIREAVARQGSCTMALAGGATPREAYARLAALPGIPWDKVEIFFGDERAFPPDHAESNYRMASEVLLRRVPVVPGKVHRMEAELPNRDATAWSYQDLLPKSLDILLLGMGTDGHTASLFPHAPALREPTRLVLPVTGGDPLVQRLTITPPVIQQAGAILVMVAGAEKAATVALALEGVKRPFDLPIQLARKGNWILDRAAASRLTRAAE
jgi:6-phosphogluconolactonase